MALSSIPHVAHRGNANRTGPKGPATPEPQTTARTGAKTASRVPLPAPTAPTSQKRLTLYLFLDTPAGCTRINKLSTRYHPAIAGSYDRTLAGLIEQAADLAAAELYKLGKRSAARVIVSTCENVDQARRDPAGLVYRWRQ